MKTSANCKLKWTSLFALNLAVFGTVVSCNASGEPGTELVNGSAPVNEETVTRVSEQVDEVSLRAVLDHLTGVVPAPLASGDALIEERGSNAGRKAAATYMKESFESFGIPAKILQFTASSGAIGYNVEATLAGQPDGRHLWVTAHLDSVHNAGASDDASGLANILLTARALKDMKPRDTIRFVAFDLEEIGLVGSANYFRTVVQPLRKEAGDAAIIGNFHSDMIGYDPGKDLGIVASCGEGGEIPAAVHKGAALARSPIQLQDDCLGRSDHKHFWDADLPAVLLTDSSKYDDYPWYHEEGDTTDKLNFPYLRAMIQATVATVTLLAYNAEGGSST